MIKKQGKYNLRWLTTSNYYHTITPVIQLSTVSKSTFLFIPYFNILRTSTLFALLAK